MKEEKFDLSEILSDQAKRSLFVLIADKVVPQIAEVIKQHYEKPPYIQQKELIEELGITYAVFKKLEAHGLKRTRLEPNGRTIFYKRSDVYELMDKLAK